MVMSNKKISSGYRIGLGFDLHKFTTKRKNIILGGFKIKCPQGLDAVSDGDVVLHAVCDAVLGAACLGDIGDYFPHLHKKSQGIRSSQIVKLVLSKINKKFKIVNIDITVFADKPRLVLHKKGILNKLKGFFSNCPVNLKIKYKEGVDFLGTKEGISCVAELLLKKC